MIEPDGGMLYRDIDPALLKLFRFSGAHAFWKERVPVCSLADYLGVDLAPERRMEDKDPGRTDPAGGR